MKITFTPIPVSNSDILAPGRGAEIWNNAYAVQVPAGNSTALDEYYRFAWFDIETTQQGVYNWTVFDREVQGAIEGKRKFSFGIMPLFMNFNWTTVGGATLSYPTYLHNQMQSESTKDWIYQGSWVPNWNSNYFLTAWENLLKAVANRISTTSYKGIAYKNVINYIDIRGYGDFGEWHTYPWTNTEPTGTKASVVTLKRIVDSHTKAFPNYPLVVIANSFDAGNASRIPAEVTHYILTATNTWGPFGWRRDNYGDPGTDVMLSNNAGSYNGLQFKTAIVDRYKTSPIVGEPNNSTDNGTYSDLLREVQLYHTTSFGNANYPSTSTTGMKANIIAASKATGYRLVVSSVDSGISGSNLTIISNWQNVGIAPTYENWDVIFEIKNNTQSLWTGKSKFTPKLFLPSTSIAVTDNFAVTGLQPGTYNLSFKIVDPSNYRKPLPLAVQGVQADGSYSLGQIIIGASVPNQLPIVSAGQDVTITLPSNTTKLTSVSTDPDGSITSIVWSQVSGPSQATLLGDHPTIPSVVEVSKLVEGSYTFRVTATDDKGDIASDTVVVTVKEAVNENPVAVAGNDLIITLPVQTVTLDGSTSSDPDGDISAYSWSISTANGDMIISREAITTITNLLEGEYNFKLTVTDNKGATSTDLIKITVLPEPYNYRILDETGKELARFKNDSKFTIEGSNNNIIKQVLEVSVSGSTYNINIKK